MTILSFALAFRIKILQEEKVINQELVLIKSKQFSLGEINGSILHQLRQPLSELSSINTNFEVK